MSKSNPHETLVETALVSIQDALGDAQHLEIVLGGSHVTFTISVPATSGATVYDVRVSPEDFDKLVERLRTHRFWTKERSA